jgi:hypothetical protein
LYWRNPSYNAIRMFFTILSALLLGSIFWNIGSKRYESFMISLVIRKIILSLIKTKAIIIIITMSLDIVQRNNSTRDGNYGCIFFFIIVPWGEKCIFGTTGCFSRKDSVL